MEWPKRARTADWENGVLALDREKQFEVPKLTAEIMERLAGYTLVGFHVKGYPVTDELLAPFAGHKSMVNFGVENGALTDACFPFFSAMPKLRYLHGCRVELGLLPLLGSGKELADHRLALFEPGYLVRGEGMPVLLRQIGRASCRERV